MPTPLRGVWGLGRTVDLGWMYYAYMALLSTFATNSINILAGVNGLEVAQALVIALSVVVNDLLYIPVWPRWVVGDWTVLEGGAVLQRGSAELVQRHLLSLYFMGPLIGVCGGFMFHNWYARSSTLGFPVLPQLSSPHTRQQPRRRLTSTFPASPVTQVPSPRFPRRHFMLFYRHGSLRHRHPSTLLENATPLLYPANLQLFVKLSAVVWAFTVSKASGTYVRLCFSSSHFEATMH
jgi:hypothetical protein